MHYIAQPQKVLTFMSWTGECQQQIHIQHAPSAKRDYDYLHGWVKETVTYVAISTKMVNPRDIAVNADEEENH